jgi:hypothetical protein
MSRSVPDLIIVIISHELPWKFANVRQSGVCLVFIDNMNSREDGLRSALWHGACVCDSRRAIVNWNECDNPLSIA